MINKEMSYYGANSRLAKIVLEKVDNDNALAQLDKSTWYNFDLNYLTSEIASKFIQFNEDTETKQFLVASEEKSNWLLTQLFHSFVLTFFRLIMSVTSINGLLQRGSMFVFSVEQFKFLMNFNDTTRLGSLMDLGAGDGAVTNKMAPFFQNIYATEMSYTMQWRLSQKGYKVLDVENWHSTVLENEEMLKFDAVSCLNLLDRCDKPITLLKQIKNSLKPNGYLITAIVMPFKPYVEYKSGNKPAEQMPFSSSNYDCNRNDYETRVVSDQINALIDQLFKPLGFNLLRFSRLPYLCEGNLAQSYYYLIDYVFVFQNVVVET